MCEQTIVGRRAGGGAEHRQDRQTLIDLGCSDKKKSQCGREGRITERKKCQLLGKKGGCGPQQSPRS